jgi:hypothetical protein
VHRLDPTSTAARGVLSVLHVAREQHRMCLTQFSAPLDKLGMAPLAFECEQTHHDTGTAFRLGKRQQVP